MISIKFLQFCLPPNSLMACQGRDYNSVTHVQYSNITSVCASLVVNVKVKKPTDYSYLYSVILLGVIGFYDSYQLIVEHFRFGDLVIYRKE